jgi:hypothetical protein
MMLVDVQSPRVVGSNTELPWEVTLMSGANFTSESAKNFRPNEAFADLLNRKIVFDVSLSEAGFQAARRIFR